MTSNPPLPAAEGAPGPSGIRASTPHWTSWLVDSIYQVSRTATPHPEPTPSSPAALPRPSPPLPDPFESPAPDSPPPPLRPTPTIPSPFFTSPFTTQPPQPDQKRPFDVSTLFSPRNNPAAREHHLKRPYLHITTSPPPTKPERGLDFDSDASEDESVRPQAPVRDPPFRWDKDQGSGCKAGEEGWGGGGGGGVITLEAGVGRVHQRRRGEWGVEGVDVQVCLTLAGSIRSTCKSEGCK